MSRKLIVLLFVAAIACASYGEVLLGNWEDVNDGWKDRASGLYVDDPTVMPSRYQFEKTVGVTRDETSLGLTVGGSDVKNDHLEYDILGNGQLSNVQANTTFSVDVTVPADAFLDDTGGFAEIWELVVNSENGGWTAATPITVNPQSSDAVYTWYFWNGSPERTATIEWDLTGTGIMDPGGWLTLVIGTNNDENRDQYYFDNARLTPEPATLALLGLGGLLLRRKR
jgi:hypothetical protein